MKTADGFYWIPIMPKALAEATSGPKKNWPKQIAAEHRQKHAEFAAAKAEFHSWVRKDRDSRMNGTAKVILSYLIECVNFRTGRCDPSQQTIADEIEVSLRTVERIIPKIAEAGWLEITQRGRTTTNFYRIRVSETKIAKILERVDGLRQRREENREKRRRRISDPTAMADQPQRDPTSMRSHEPTKMTDHDPTEMTDKPMKGTCEAEPLNEIDSSEEEGLVLSTGKISLELSTGKISYYRMSDDDPDIPYQVPENENEAIAILKELGLSQPHLNFLLKKWMAGKLTPEMLETHCETEHDMLSARSRAARSVRMGREPADGQDPVSDSLHCAPHVAGAAHDAAE